MWRQQCSAVTANLQNTDKTPTTPRHTQHTTGIICFERTKQSQLSPKKCWQALLLFLSPSHSLSLSRVAHSPVKPVELWPLGFRRASSRTRTRQLVALLLHGVSWLLDRCLMTASLVTPVASLVRRLPPSPRRSRRCECMKSFEYFVLNSIWGRALSVPQGLIFHGQGFFLTSRGDMISLHCCIDWFPPPTSSHTY